MVRLLLGPICKELNTLNENKIWEKLLYTIKNSFIITIITLDQSTCFGYQVFINIKYFITIIAFDDHSFFISDS